MKEIVFMLSMLFAGTFAKAQGIPTPSPEHIEAMKKVSFIEGAWKGSGWMQMGPTRHEFLQSEQVSLKVNGVLLQIDGLGIDAKDNKTVIHNAFGIITYDPAQDTYSMQAYRGDGARIDAYLKPLSDQSFEWGFRHPMAGDMRYIITVKNNEWIETGEMSRDGKQWFKFLEMKLIKN